MYKANRIRILRKKRGMTMQALASSMGTSQQQIDRLEKGQRRLTVEWMEKLSDALDCSITELLPSAYKEREQATCKVKVVGETNAKGKVSRLAEKDVYSLLVSRPANPPSPRMFAVIVKEKNKIFPVGSELIFCEIDEGKKIRTKDNHFVIYENGETYIIEKTPLKDKKKKIKAVLLKSIRPEWV